MKQNWYSTRFYFIGLLILIFNLLSLEKSKAQCIKVKDPLSGAWTNSPQSYLRCPALLDPIAGTVLLNFQSSASNFTIDWGNGDIQTYPGPQTSISYTFTTANLFKFIITTSGCPDTVKGTYVNQRNVTAGGVSVPGVGFIVPPAGVSNKRCVPEDLTILNGSPGMNGYTKWLVEWGDLEQDTIGNDFMRAYTHTYLPGTTGCSLQIKVTYLNGCGINPINRPKASYGDYFFKDIDSAAITPTTVILCAPTDVNINDISKLNCLDSIDREILWTRTLGFAAPLPNPGDNVFRPYTPANRLMRIPTASFFPIPFDSTYKLKMVIRNSCGDDSADATIRIVSPTQPKLAVINNNTCPGQQMNFSNLTSNRPYQSYKVDFGDGTVQNLGFSSTFSNTYKIGGTYKVKLWTLVNGYNGQTCGLVDSILVQVKTTVSPIVNVNPKMGCDTLTVRLENNSINTAGVVWKGWELGGNPLITAGSGVLPSMINFLQAQVLSNNLIDSSSVIKFKQPGRYIIRLRAQSLGCPEISDFDTVDVYPSPVLRWKIPATNICLGNSITIRDSSSVIPSASSNRRSLLSNWNHISWKMDMGDGTVYNSSSNITGNFSDVQGTNRLTSHTYVNAGIYWVKLSVQSPNRCPKVDSVKVTVLPAAVPNFKWKRDICNPGLLTLMNQTNGSSQRYEWIFKRGTVLVGKEIRLAKDTFTYFLPYFPPGDSAFYFVTLRAVSGSSPDTCIASTAPILVKIPPTKQALFSSSALDGCTPINDVIFVNQSIGIPTDGSHIYNWSFGNGNTFIGENPPFQNYVNNGAGFRRDTVRLEIKSNGPCSYKGQKIITIYPIPNTKIVAPSEVCHNTPVTFSATGNGLGSFDWSFVELDGTNSSQQNPVRNFVNTGSLPIQYTIKLTASTVAGCQDTALKAIIVNPRPSASFTATPEAACGASPVIFDASSSVSANTFTWTFSDGTSGIADTIDPVISRFFPENTSSVDKTYNVTLFTKSDKGCTSPNVSKLIRIRPTVIANFIPDTDSGCSPLVVNFQNFSSQTDDNYTWYVNELGAPGLGVPSLPNRPARGFAYTFYNNSYTNVARFVVTLIVKDDNGNPICESSKSDTITVLPKPLAAFVRDMVNPSSLCSPTSMRVKASGTQGANSYTWTFSDASLPIFSGDSIPFFKVFFNNGTAILPYSINLIVKNDFGCTDTSTQSLNIRPKVIAKAIVDKTIGCSPLLTNFTNQSSASVVSYTWFKNDIPVFFNKDIPQQTFQNNSASDTANYTVYLVARGEGDVCTDTSKKLKIRVLPKPEIAISSSPANGCSPLSVQLNATGTVGGTSYTWFAKKSTDLVYAQIQTSNSPNAFSYTLVNSGSAAVNFQIKLLVSGIGGCLDSSFTTVTVFPDVVPSFTASVLQGCAPLRPTFNNTSTGPIGTSYVWKVDGIPQFNPLPLVFNYTFVSQSDTANTQYLVTLQAVSGSGCTRELSQTVTVFPKPKPEFSLFSSPSSACSPVFARFIPSVKGQIASYVWVYDNADSLATTKDTTIYRNYINSGSQSFTHNVKLKVATANGCKSEVSKSVQVNPKVVAGFSQSATEGCSPLKVDFINDGSSFGANVFEWFVDGILVGNSASGISQTFTNGSFSATKVYTIQLVAKNNAANACVDTATKYVIIYRKPEVSASAFPTTGCSPFKTSLTASNSQGGVLFQWFKKLNNQSVYQADTTTIAGNAFDRVFTNSSSSMLSYDIKVVVTGADGCKDSAVVSISVAPGVKANFTASPGTAGCAPYASVFGNATTSAAANSYQWFVDGVGISNSPAFLSYSFENTSNTDVKVYKVQLVASNATFGCPDTATKNISAWPKPLVNQTITMDPSTGCSPINVGFQPINFAGVTTFSWLLPDTVNTTLDTIVKRSYVNNNVIPQTRWVTLIGRNAFGCESQKISNFQVNPRVQAGIKASRDSICSPAEISFTNTSSPGVNVAQWYINGVFKGNSLSGITDLFENNDSIPKQFNIKLVVRNSITTACEDTAFKIITIFPKPLAGNIFASIENGCSPLFVNFKGSAAFASRYIWDFADGTTKDTTSQEISHQFVNFNSITNAQFTVWEVAINAFGCADSTSTLINVRPNVTAGIIASDSVGCNPTSISFSGAASINANTYSWDFGNASTATGSSVSRIFTNTSDTSKTFKIRLIADRAGVGCPDTAFVSVKVNPKPTSDFDASPNAGCQPLSVRFSNNSQLATDGFWLISSGPKVDTIQGLNGFDSTFINTTSLSQIVKAELFVLSGKGCTAQSSKLVTVSPFVKAEFIQSADSGCSPLAVNFTNLSAAGATSSWFVDDVLINNSSGQFNYSFVNSSQTVKIFEIKLLVSSVLNSGCMDTMVSFVKVFPKPVAGVLGAVPDNGCSPVNIGLFSNAIGASRYLYDFNDGSVMDTNLATVNHNFINNAGLTTRNFNVKLVVSNAYGCADNTSKLVSIKPTVTAVITTSDSVGCTPYSVGLNGLNSINSNIYTWDFGDGTGSALATPVKVFNNTTDSIQHYSIQLITDRTGVNCPDTSSFKLRVFPKPVVEFAPNPLIGCNPFSVGVQNLTTGSTSATWTFSGNGLTVNHPVSASNFDSVFVNDQSTANLIVSISQTAINQLGCADTKTRDITVYPAVQAAFSQSIDTGCSPVKVRFTNQALPGNLVNWFVDGQLVGSLLSNFNYTFVNNGQGDKTFEVKMIARSALAQECMDTVISHVTVHPKPNAGFINAMPEIACSPAKIDFVGTATGATLFSWNFGDGSEIDTNAQEIAHVYNNTNSNNNRVYRTRLVARNDVGCTDTSYKNITIRPLVSAVIASNDSLGCSPYAAQFNGSQSTNANQYFWSFGGSGTSTLMNPKFTFINNSDSTECHTVRLITQKSGVECSDTAIFKVCVFPLSIPVFNINPVSGCQPLSVRFTNQSTLADSSVWQFTSGGIQNETTALNYDTTIENNTSQIKTVKVRLFAYTKNGCVNSIEKQFTVAPFVKADFSQNVDSGCAPLKVNFVNLSSVGSSAAWFIDGSQVSSANNTFGFTLLNSTSITRIADVMLVVRNNLVSSCADTIRKKIWIFAKPDAGVISATPDAGCSPLLSQFSAAPNIGNRFIWDFKDGNVLDTNILTVSHEFVNYNPSAIVPFNVMFVAISDKGCTDTSYKSVAVSPFTIARIGIADSVGCSPLSMQFAGALSQNANRFVWDFGDGGNSSLVPNPIRSFVNNGQQDLTLNVRLIASRQGFSCPDTAYKTIKVFANPRASFTANTYSGCGPLPVQFVNNSELADSTMWVISSLAGVDTLWTKASNWDTTFSNNFSQQMNVRVELHVWSRTGCYNSLVRNILVNPDVKAEFSASGNGCSPLSVKFTNTSTNPGGAFQWTFGDGSPASSMSNPAHIFTYNGGKDTTFNVSLLAISNPSYAPACNKTFNLPVAVYAKPAPEFFMDPEILQLPQTSVTFSNLTPYRPNWKYKWLFGDNTQDTSSSLNVYHDYASIVKELSNTNVKITLIAFNPNGCSDSIQKILQIRPIKPLVDFGPDTSGCAPLMVHFKNKSKYGSNYFWTFGDGTSSTEQNPAKRYEQAGTFSVSLRVTGPGGEVTLKRDNIITVFENPDASFTTVPKAPRVLKIPEEKMNCFVRYPQAGWSYEWNFGDGSSSRQKDPVHQYKEPGSYTITVFVTSAEGCTDRDTLSNGAIVEKGNLIIVPNAFTPRKEGASEGFLDKEDGTNDIFYPLTEGVTEIRLQIFNRWGQFIYESTTLNRGWDGTFNGTNCKSDVYVYKVWCRFVDGRTETRVGDLSLLR